MKTHEILEGFAVETVDGLIFTAKGLVHPPDRVIAYLRYLPDQEGTRNRGGRYYRRVYHFKEQQQILETRYPFYLHYDPAFGIRLQSVPLRLIRQVYDPRCRLSDIRRRGPEDSIEKTVLALTGILSQTACVPLENLGISGSVLVKLHQSESDMDIVVYGELEGQAIHRTLYRLMADTAVPLLPLDTEQLTSLHSSHRLDTPLSFADFARLQVRKVNEGSFQGVRYFIRFVKWLTQWEERYGDPSFQQLGSGIIQARVKDDRDAIFSPCRYHIEDVSFLRGAQGNDLREVISFRGRFSDQVRAGERLRAKGSLERVVPRSALAYCRLMVGGRVGDYLVSEG